MAASDWVLDAPAPAPAPTPPVTSPPASDWVLDAPPPASAAPPDDPAAATSDWVVDPPEKQGFFGGVGSGATSLARETGQLVTGQAFSDANIQPPPERTFMGNVGASLPGMAVIAGAGAAGAGVGSLIGPWGTVAGGVLGAGAAAFAQGLIPAYSEARQRGLSHDDAVSEAYTSAAASGTLTGATVPLFAWAPFKSQVSNLLLHSLTTGPAVGAVQQGIVTPAVTGQPMPSAGEMAEGAAINALGGGMMAAGQHYAPRIAGRLVGRPGEIVPPPEPPPPAPDVNPPGSYGRELFTIPPEGVDPTVTPPEAPPPGTPPVEPPPVTPTTPVEPPPVTVAPPAVPTPIPAEPPVKEPPPDVARPIAPQPQPEPGTVGTVPVAPVEPAASPVRPGEPVIQPEPGPRSGLGPEPELGGVSGPVEPLPRARPEPVPGPGPVEPGPGPEPGAVAPLPRTEPEQPPTPAPAVQPAGVPAPEPSPAYRTEHPDIPATLYRGSGREDQASVYNPAGDTAIPILGPGRYAAFSEEHAKQFGPNVETTPLDLKNPLVIRTDDQWRALTREAGWKFPNLFGLDKTEVARNTQDMRDLVQAKGHDGVIVHWDDSTPYDIDQQGRSIKTLRNVFGDPQVVDYRAPREAATPGGPADILARLDAEKAPDTAYRDALSTGSKEPLKAGETWRDRLVKWAESEKQPLETRELTPEGPPDPAAIQRVLASSADQISPKDMVLENLDQGGMTSGVIAPDGRLYVFHQKRGGRYDAEITHREFQQDFPGHPYAEVTVYNGNKVGITSHQAYTTAQTRTINLIRAHATRSGGETHVSHYDEKFNVVHVPAEGGTAEDTLERYQAVNKTTRDAPVPDASGRTPDALLMPDGTWSIIHDTGGHGKLISRSGFAGSIEEFLDETGVIRTTGAADFQVHQTPTAGQREAMARQVRASGADAFNVDAYDLEGDVQSRRFPPSGRGLADMYAWLRDVFKTSEPEITVTAEDLSKRGPGGFRGATRKAPAPGTPEPLPKRVGTQKRYAPTPPPETGRPLTLEDYNYSRDVSMERQGFHDALAGTGEDPRTAANKPMPEQIKMLSNAVADKYKFTDVKVETKPSIYLDKSGKERISPAVEPRITRDQLLNMHQNMQNVAYAHDWAPEVMSLDGRLNLHLVPRDFQGEHWMGQYSFGPKTIGISGGSNSFAHELWHGIDHYLSDTLNKNPNKQALLSWDGRAGTLDPKADRVQAAFAHMLNTMSHGSGEILQRRLVLERVAQKVNKAGQPTKDAITARQQLDRLNSGATGGLRIPVSDFVKQAQGMQNPRYYASVHELMARMGEAYSAYKAELKGVNTAGVVKPNKAYTDQTIKYLRDAYPNPFDRIRNFAAWDNLALEMQHAAVLNHGHAPAQRASDANTLAMWHDRPPDIGPGFVARLKEDAKALLPSRLLGPEHDKLLFPEGRTPRPLTYATKGEVPRPKNLGESAADSLAQIFNSAVGNLHRMIEQAHPNAKPYARQILDRIAVSHGVKTARPMTMFERERTYARADVAQTEDQFKDNGLVNRVGRLRTTPLEDSMFWHTLTSGEKTYPLDPFDPGKGRVPIPDKLLAMAEQQRPLLDAIHERAKATGLEVQYRDRYAPRIWDDPRILSDKAGYIKDLTKANRFDMDKDIAGSPERLHQWWDESERAMREDPNLDVIKPGAAAGMEQMGKNHKRIGQIDKELAAAGTLTAPGASPTTHNPTALRAERDTLVRQNQDLYNQFHGAVKDHIAGLEAENRYDAIALGGPSNFETFGPSSKFLRHRTMSPEMDQMMRRWLVQNPRTGLANYYVGMNRKIAYHEVFGKNGEDIEILRRHFVDNGGTREASDLIKNIVELMGGRSLRDNDKATTNVTNLVSAMGMLRSLPGASISAFGEPFATLLNQGSPRMMFKTFTHLFGQFMGTASGAERMATARAIGAVSPRLMGAAAAGRFSDYSGTPWIANLTNGFFELALSPAIRNIRAAVLGAGTEHMKLLTRLATDPAVTRGQLNRKDDAQRMLRDWGVPDKRFQEFRDWLHQEEGLPSRTRITRDLKDMGGLYRLAANRMLNRFNQDPTAAEKPLASLKSPYMNMATQLTAFPYSFWLNTMEPMLKRASYNRQRQYDRSLAAGATHNEARFQAEVARFGAWSNAAMGATALLAGTGLMSAARTYFLSHDTWKKHEEAGDLGGWLLSNAVSQSGMSGPLDIPNQAFTGLRYHSDLAQLTEGPYLSGDLRFAADIVKGLEGAFGAGPTPQTNTENYNAIYALTQLAVKPGALSGLVWLAERVPAGGPLAALITAASILGTSGTAMRGLTDIAAGERGTKLPKEGAEGDTGEPSLTTPDVSMTDLEQGAESGGANAGGGSGLTNLGVGFLDDLLMPAMRIAPTSLKLGIGGLAAAGGLGGLLKQGQMYKSQGVPPEKVH